MYTHTHTHADTYTHLTFSYTHIPTRHTHSHTCCDDALKASLAAAVRKECTLARHSYSASDVVSDDLHVIDTLQTRYRLVTVAL